MRGLLTVAMLVVLSAPIGADEPDKVAEYKKQLQGKWVTESVMTGGKTEAEAEWLQLSWEFKGDKVTITHKSPIPGEKPTQKEWKFAIDPSKTPAHIDVISQARAPFEYAGIYRLEKDTLTVCWASSSVDEAAEARPKKFETSKKDFDTLITLKRAK